MKHSRFVKKQLKMADKAEKYKKCKNYYFFLNALLQRKGLLNKQTWIKK